MTLPLVLSIPHCGTEIPDDIWRDFALSETEAAEAEDLGTREVFSDLPALICHVARYSRLVVDLNRPADDYGPKGVIALADYHGRTVFKPGREPDRAETKRRVEVYYQPYHQALRESAALPELKLLLDCHSMDGVGPSDAPDPGRARADINLGNSGGYGGEANPRRGSVTCPPNLTRDIAAALKAEGFKVSLNSPYAGGYITRIYGHALARKGKASLQIELNKDLYLSPQGRLDPDRIADTRQAIKAAFANICPKL